MNNLNYIFDEKTKLIKLNKHNSKSLGKLKNMTLIVDKIDEHIDNRINKHIHELNNHNSSIQENIQLFKCICQNIL